MLQDCICFPSSNSLRKWVVDKYILYVHNAYYMYTVFNMDYPCYCSPSFSIFGQLSLGVAKLWKRTNAKCTSYNNFDVLRCRSEVDFAMSSLPPECWCFTVQKYMHAHVHVHVCMVNLLDDLHLVSTDNFGTKYPLHLILSIQKPETCIHIQAVLFSSHTTS